MKRILFKALVSWWVSFYDWISFQHFILCTFNFESSFSGKIFCWCHFFWDIFIFLLLTLSSFILISSPSLNYPAAYLESPQWQWCQHSQVILLERHLYSVWISPLVLSLFVSLLTLIFVSQSSLLIIQFLWNVMRVCHWKIKR